MYYEKIYLYENRKDVSLTAYILDDSNEMRNGLPRGAVLILPGGAYLLCSDREAEPVAMSFAAMGYHAFVLRYSVYGKGNSMPEITEPIAVMEHSVFPNPLHDVSRAMEKINKRARQWRVDMGKIALCGFSAGGHNAAMYSVYWDKPLLTDLFGNGVDTSFLRPAASILCYPLTDFTLLRDAPIADEDIRDAAYVAYFGTTNPTDEQILQASPPKLVDKSTPPTFLWTTADDTVTRVNQTLAMANSLAANHVPFEMHVFENGLHGLSLANYVTAGDKKGYENADAAKWIGLCEAWLKKRV